MNTEDVVCAVIDSLNAQDVPYMIVGSLATNFYCVPRSTQDGDFVVQSNLADIAMQISKQHAGLKFDPQLAFESVTATKKVVLRSREHDFEIELFELSDDEHDQQRFARRIQADIFGRPAWIAALEDMIVTKLRWSEHAGREKDVADVRNLIAVQCGTVDWPYVESWCERHGTRPLLERLRQECEER